MRIIQMIASLGSGGAETLVKDLSIGLKNKNAEILVIVVDEFNNSKSGLHKIKKLEEHGIQVKSAHRKPGKIQLSTLLNINKLIKEFQPDIIHFHSFIAGIYLIPHIVFRKNKKYFQTIHNTMNFLGRFNLMIQKHILSRFCNIIYCSNSANKKLHSLYGEGTTISNGVKVNKPNNIRDNLLRELEIPKNSLICINVGRISKQKNQIILLELIEEMNRIKYKGKLHLIICGANKSDDIYDKLIKKHQELNYKKQIHFLGVRNNITDLMNASDLFISTSIFEGLPITGLEAANIGIPMILSPINEHLLVFKDEYEIYFPNNPEIKSYIKLFSELKINSDKEKILFKRSSFNDKYSMENNINKHYSLFKNTLTIN